MKLQRSLLKGAFWTATSTYLNLLLTIIVTMILSRIIEPSDFGIVSMVYIYNGFMALIANAGLNSAVVQKQKLSGKDLSTVFWFSLILGVAITGITFLIAPVIETFFGYPGLKAVVKVMSLNLFILSFSNVPLGIMRKQLRFKAIAFIDVVSALTAGFVAVILALNGASHWSLVFQSLIFNGIKSIGYFIFCCWLPGMDFRYSALRTVFGYSNYLLGFNTINYWARNADNLLIGKFLGAMELGFYNQAYKLMILPIRLITNAVTPALHPVFAGIQNETKNIKYNYFKVLEIIALFAFPMGVYFVVYGDVVIRALWSDKFIASIPIFRVLALLTMFQPLVSSSGAIFMACNRAILLFHMGFFNAFIMIGGISIGLIKGTLGVATGYTISYLVVVLPVTFFFLLKTVGAKSAELIDVFRKPLFIAIIFLVSLMVFKSFTTASLSIWMSFLASFAFAFVIFMLFVFTAYRKLLKNIYRIIRRIN